MKYTIKYISNIALNPHSPMISSYFLVTTLHHHRQAECGDAQRAAVSFSRRVPVAVVRAGVAVGSESQAMKYGE